MKKLIRFFTDIRVLALIFAVILWFYVVGTQGPTIEKVINDIPVIPVNVPSGSFVSGSLGSVSITAEGPGKVIIGLKNNDFSAIADLSNKTIGVHLVSVEVRSPTSSVLVKSVNPSQVSVTLETLSTRTIPVSVEFVNSSPTGFIPDVPIVSPQSVIVSGPESSIAMISRAFVSLDLSTVEDGTVCTLPIKLEMKDGRTQEDIYINPSTCVVEVKKSKNDISITLPILANLSGVPQKGFGIKSVSVTPNFVIVTGQSDVVKGLSGISTLPIDVSKFTKNTSLEINLQPPQGTKLNADKCKVDIIVQPLATSKITVPITILHDPSKITSSHITAVDFVVSSFKDVIDAIQIENIKAVIDATGLDSGTYTLPVSITGLPAEVIVNEMSPREVQVTLY